MPKARQVRPLTIALAAIVLIIIAAIYSKIRPEQPKGYVASTGVVEATEVELTSEAAGRIGWLCCEEGGSIKKGDIAVRLESDELKARVEEGRAAISGAISAIEEARAELENSEVLKESAKFEAEAAKAEIDRVKALADEAKENIDRARGLFKEGFIAKKDLDAAAAAFDSNNALLSAYRARARGAEANLRNSKVNIKASRARISSAESRKAQAEARLKVLLAELEDTEIDSPISGIIVYKALEPGEFVNPGLSIYTIDDLSNLWARVDIEETEIQKIKLGDRSEITFPGKQQAFSGKVIEIGEVGGFATQRDVTRGRPDIKTFRVKTSIAGGDGVFKPGMTVEVRIYTEEANGEK
ncbi:MAG: efflux RND transporter periplasmic adaptor subunit [Deltaproteobacteria bacterium]|nr:efflux RND transporter periplasmic adaptor subunit [Deltaproteobacteria bacterium]